jgi:hypothetical protein
VRQRARERRGVIQSNVSRPLQRVVTGFTADIPLAHAVGKRLEHYKQVLRGE